MARAHTHPCKFCKTPVDCDGDLERNYDGAPEVICTAVHRPGGYTEPMVCASCARIELTLDGQGI